MAQQPQQPQQQRSPDSLQPGNILVVVHDFDARGPDELTLRKAERVELVELDDGFGDGWYLGRHLTRGATGLFPAGMSSTPKNVNLPNKAPVYTAKLPANIAAMHSPTAQSYVHSPNAVPPIVSDPSSSNHGFAEGKQQETRPLSDSTYGQTAPAPFTRNSLPQNSSSYNPMVQRSIGETLGGTHNGQDSPVMNETLSVIDEHITDLSTPRQSLGPPQRITEDSESEYSSHLDRMSFLAGPETDEEDNAGLTKEEVSQWDHKQVAAHLRSLGVDSRHCDIFEEQEISGDVLLEMDQSFIQMKEFDFGVMGRRLKTWHKIRDFQLEVSGSQSSRQNSNTPQPPPDTAGRTGSRVLSGGAILPRIPSLSERQGLQVRQSQQSAGQLPSPTQTQQSQNGARTSQATGTPPSSWRASTGPDSPSRPSAAQLRDTSHSRRHSSIDFGKPPDLELSSASFASTTSPHKKQPSFDRHWSGAPHTPASTNITSPSIHTHTLKKQESLDMSLESPLLTGPPNLDLDRGYFSGNEVDNRKSRNVLKKRESTGSPAHSRQSSMLDEPRRATTGTKRHSRLSSVDSSRDPAMSFASPASKAYHSSSFKGRFRSASARGPMLKQVSSGHSPTVTNLENEQITALPSAEASLASKMNIPAKARKLMGLRAASEAVTDTEKASASSSQNILPESLEDSPVASPADGSQTPSATSHSFDFENTDASSKAADQAPSVGLSTRASQRARPKTKQQTSAYTKGLLKITPEEARKHCDHHGWMKKKSSTLMTTWKPRLFILRGRRLSYYYSENDTEERGIIDISGHKVLVANSDPITTLHATITGAKGSPFPSPNSGDTSPTTPKTPNQAFFFKLVPPKAGMSRAVQFTKPTIHYFQVDSTAEGRKWMGEIMKATIMHDLTTYETTNKQKTITLAKAKARKERPPGLKDVDEMTLQEDDEEDNKENKDKENPDSGLNISGLEMQSSALTETIEEEKEALSDDQAATQPGQPSTAVS
ncbi:uncharacterized protein HMPREF1541_07512 [Cyphellophora europaea CBS 101466]|uniref:Polarized growth protein Boi2 n=1 Tax=Cyphellophora europaea (strain CBS 101466) TaxID=1220924 RepID=W2RQA2_CYPE1|nr:uncharacterized protein HMPREF1541_07512 [Cyphellophora europaea CBS 101466]ETN37889.1 hypothetical protein HMPREF1541_07512 [Cyphellophora europaea CBS 101466]